MKQVKLIFTLLTVIFLLIPGQSFSQWIQTSGPEGGYVDCFGVDGDTLYAGTYGGGIFASTNYGSSWSDCSTGLTNRSINAIITDGSNIFAGTEGGVFISSNSGAQWTAASAGITNTNIQALIISGSNIFSGTNGGGVYFSTNNGTN